MVPGTWPRVARYLRVRMRPRVYQSGEIDYEIAADHFIRTTGERTSE